MCSFPEKQVGWLGFYLKFLKYPLYILTKRTESSVKLDFPQYLLCTVTEEPKVSVGDQHFDLVVVVGCWWWRGEAETLQRRIKINSGGCFIGQLHLLLSTCLTFVILLVWLS